MATREVGAASFDHGVVAIGELTNKLISLRKLARTDQLRIARVRVAPTQVFFDRSREEDVLLEDDGNCISQRFEAVVANVDAADRDLSFGDVIEARDQLNE